MLLSAALISAGFIMLVWGADRFVVGSSATALNLGLSPLLIGITIVGFGTSAPEILVSFNAALSGSPGLAIGNAIGSNIANIGLILGLTAIFSPLTVHSTTLRREMPLLLVVSLFVVLPFLNGHLSRADGVLLLFGLVAMMFFLVRVGLRTRSSDPIVAEIEDEIRTDLKLAGGLTWLLIGLVVLLIGSRMLVIGAVDIAARLGVSDLIIGLTIVAIGTSLPELAASISAALKKEHDLVIGNLIGSNMYNLLAVLGVAGVIGPTDVDEAVLTRDFPVMIGLTVFLFAIAYDFQGKAGRVRRSEAVLLLVSFVIYQYLIGRGIL